ncbi:MAG: hypothetical protein RMM17_14115 [Acidobacteriota bacterium]|nr:hypothetical protein [Blastocatellia bacterium]MDW8413804.1 hypothetical protein [Acidobacteriota bacterium]
MLIDEMDKRLKQKIACAEMDAARRAGASTKLKSVEKKVFRNSCLDAAEEGEMCKMALTRGYEIVVVAAGNEYVYRTEGLLLRLVVGQDRGKKLDCDF